jgi:fibronectin-binding autotransporter adhesin
METKHINLGVLATSIVALSLLVATSPVVFAVDAVWLPNPGSGVWNTGTNWSTSPSAPVNPGDTATFETSTQTSLTLSATTTVESITFSPGASAFTINTNGHRFSIQGVGIVNNSGQTETMTSSAGGLGTVGLIRFLNTSTAGSASVISVPGVAVEGVPSGAFGSSTEFHDGSTAASATITNGASQSRFATSGFTIFSNISTAGSATITNDGATAIGGSGGFTEFHDSSRAGNATITSNGGTAGGDGGRTVFFDSSDGETASAITNGNGRFDISGLTAAGMGIGSIEGSGNYFLGSKALTVGRNNLSTPVSGIIQDDGEFGGTGGSLTKVGTGTLILSGTNTYTGGTTINAGTLQLGSGGTTGSILGDVVDNGTLAFNRSNDFFFDGGISGMGGIVKLGDGTLTLTGINTYSGATTVSAGVLQANSVGAFSAGSAFTINTGPCWI